MTFQGYRRPDGRVGIRNHVLIIPSVFCANRTAQMIAAQVPGSVCMPHPLGCGQVGKDLEMSARTLIALGSNPNVYAVLVVGLGCERIKPQEMVDGISSSGKPVEKVVIQDIGDTASTVEAGARIVKRWMTEASRQRRVPCDSSELIVAVKCGGTDATSGIAANPAVGAMSDLVVDAGGTVVLSEINELVGAEHILASRAADETVKNQIYETIYRMEKLFADRAGDPQYENRRHLISTGNFAGGVSSIVEKALGGVHKSGSRPIIEVTGYAECPKKRGGVVLMDSPSHDGEVVTSQVGGGAQIVVFTTGRGTPAGFPIAPVIKVTGNRNTWARMKEDLDFDASGILSHETSLEEAGKALFDLVMDVADGRITRAEAFGHDELFCVTRW